MPWFKCDSKLAFRADMFDVSLEGRAIWIFLLGIMADKKSDEFELTYKFISHHNCSISNESIDEILNKLKENGHIEYFVNEHEKSIGYHNSKLQTPAVTQIREDKIREDKSNAQIKDCEQKSKISNSDIEELYKIYPRKQGKKRGVSKLVSHFKKKPDDYERVKISIQNYAHYIALNKIEMQFTKHFDSFVSEWEDWQSKENVEDHKSSSSSIDQNKIKALLAQGIQTIKELPPGKLNQAEIDFIQNNGGFAQLGRMDNYNLNNLLREVA